MKGSKNKAATHFSWDLWLLGPLAGMVLVALMGAGATLRLLKQNSAQLVRSLT
ncbi:hypothetical protein [Agarivorans gilvus]|uniref:Uncharacterized protein n=1 Tax=Agarivorans gilvus TaxID=680279 RepID=A0ABQ1HWF9_9ALTE|nr:hypothetical protein [Agarivorans gilvus]GGA94882.1 hypothetical protein GCM10007414_04520 [Agarivorans gilvus]